MPYWITTQWPPREGDAEEPPSGVWLPDVRDAAGLPKDCDPLHTFRRNLATTATKRCVPKHYTMRLGGWLSDRMVDHSTQTDAETLYDAADVMSRKPRETNGEPV